MRILFILHALNLGGAQRVAVTLANHWVEHGHTVRILTLDDGESFFPLDPRVERDALGVMGDSPTPAHAVLNNIRRLTALRRAVKSAATDAAISFLGDTNIKALLATIGLKIPVIISERNNPRKYHMGKAWRTLRRLAYPRAAALVVQTEEIKEFFTPWLKTPTPVLVNPVSEPPDSTDSPDSPAPPPGQNNPVIVAMGRLHPQKGFDVLLRAFARVAEANPAWSLVVYGEGGERANLEKLRDELGLQGRAAFPGAFSPAHQALRHADMFAFSSRYEGFPNSLLEAMACGVACVSTDCPTGPGEIIEDGVNGLLAPVDDPEAMGQRLEQLMRDPEERSRLGEQAKGVLQRYGVASVAREWENLVRRYGVNTK